MIGEVAPEHLVLAGGGDPRGRLPHHSPPVDAPALRVLRHLLQRRQDRPRSVPEGGEGLQATRSSKTLGESEPPGETPGGRVEEEEAEEGRTDLWRRR